MICSCKAGGSEGLLRPRATNTQRVIHPTDTTDTRQVPPFVPEGAATPLEAIANPLPQALVLTAIVIAFSFFAFLLVLVFRSYQELGTDDTDEMREAEPADEASPPLGY